MMLVTFNRRWQRLHAKAGEVRYLEPDIALPLLERGIVTAVHRKREQAVPADPERAVIR